MLQAVSVTISPVTGLCPSTLLILTAHPASHPGRAHSCCAWPGSLSCTRDTTRGRARTKVGVLTSCLALRLIALIRANYCSGPVWSLPSIVHPFPCAGQSQEHSLGTPKGAGAVVWSPAGEGNTKSFGGRDLGSDGAGAWSLSPFVAGGCRELWTYHPGAGYPHVTSSPWHAPVVPRGHQGPSLFPFPFSFFFLFFFLLPFLPI